MSSRYPLASHLLVAGLGVLLCIAQAAGFVFHSWTHTIGNADSFLNIRILAWLAHAFSDPELSLWNTPIFYPVENALAFGDSMLGNLPITLPIQYLTNNPVFTANMLGFISLVATMFSVYLLVRSMTGSFWAGVIAGALFSFNPYRWSHFPHLQLLPFFWTPLALLFAHKFFKSHNMGHFVWMLVFIWAQYYASLYLGTMLLTLLLVQFLIQLRLERQGRDRWIFFTDAKLRRMLMAGFFFSILVLLPLAYPYLKIFENWSALRNLDEVTLYSAEPLGFLSPSAFLNYEWLNSLFPQILPPGEGRVFFGMLPWVLAFLGLTLVRNTETSPEYKILIKRFSWTALVMIILMLGPFLNWLRVNTGIPLPYQLFYFLFPGFSSIRVPARFAQPLLLCLVVVGGFALAHWSSRWRQWKPGARAALILVGLSFIFWENAIRIYPVPVEIVKQSFPAYEYLASAHPKQAILELPQDHGQAEHEFLVNQTAHWRPKLGGRSGWLPPGYMALHDYVTHCPSIDCFENLKHIPFQTLVVHLKYFSPHQKKQWLATNPEPFGFTLQGNMDNILIWEKKVPHPVSSQLEITNIYISTTNPPSSLFSEKGKSLLYFMVQPNESGKPWHFLKKKFGEVEITIHTKGGQIFKTIEKLELPPYLMPGEVSGVALKIEGPPPKDYASIHIRGTHIQTYETWNPEKSLLEESLTSMNPKSGLQALAMDWTFSEFRTLQTQQFFLIKGKIQNTGSSFWLDKPYLRNKYLKEKGRVRIGVRWISKQQVATCSDVSLNTLFHRAEWVDINHIVAPGQSIPVKQTLMAPNIPGTYFLAMEMLSDDVIWFNNVGPSFFFCAETQIQ